MSSTRSFKSPGIFAEDASTTIPPTPIAGVSYRDAVTGADDTPNGWRYGTKVESQDWNQVMFMLTSMLAMQDRQGLLGWSDQVDYDVPAIVFGSNGLLYIALQASGPSTAPQDPTAGLPYWSDFSMHGQVALTSSQAWVVPTAMQLGYIKPKVTVIGGGGGGGRQDSSAGGGGGEGGESISVLSLSGVSSVSVTIGAGGAGAIASGGGSVGGTSSFGAFMSASGGGGGGVVSGGVGGVASGGTINNEGAGGGQSSAPPIGSGFVSGSGGNGPRALASTVSAPGTTSARPGSGGCGSVLAANGGNGAPGIVIIEW